MISPRLIDVEALRDELLRQCNALDQLYSDAAHRRLEGAAMLACTLGLISPSERDGYVMRALYARDQRMAA